MIIEGGRVLMDGSVELELHDARVSGVRVEPSGTIMVEFGHISGFVQAADGMTDVWSCIAGVELSGVSRFVIEGEMSARDYVSDGLLRNGLGNDISLVWPGGSEGPGVFEVLLAGSGCKISATFRTVRIVKCEKARLLERLEK